MFSHNSPSELNADPPRRSSRGRSAIVMVASLASLAALAFWLAPARGRAAPVALAAATDTMTVYKSPTCDCCGKWIVELRNAGFTVAVVEQADISPVKTRLNVPAAVVSCHTATIGGYVVEGHVPPEDIVRLLKERPAILGIAVPGMPTGSPGMDGPKVPYTVVSFDRAGALNTFAER